MKKKKKKMLLDMRLVRYHYVENVFAVTIIGSMSSNLYVNRDTILRC